MIMISISIIIIIIIWNSILIYYTFYKKCLNSWYRSFSSLYQYIKNQISFILFIKYQLSVRLFCHFV